MRRILWGTLLTAGACALPARDNAHDSANAPRAILRVVDEGAGCAGPGTEVVLAPRGHCLVLDASATSDPQQDADGLTYVFEFAVGSTSFQVIPGIGSTVAEALPAAFKDAPSRRHAGAPHHRA